MKRSFPKFNKYRYKNQVSKPNTKFLVMFWKISLHKYRHIDIREKPFPKKKHHNLWTRHWNCKLTFQNGPYPILERALQMFYTTSVFSPSKGHKSNFIVLITDCLFLFYFQATSERPYILEGSLEPTTPARRAYRSSVSSCSSVCWVSTIDLIKTMEGDREEWEGSSGCVPLGNNEVWSGSANN